MFEVAPTNAVILHKLQLMSRNKMTITESTSGMCWSCRSSPNMVTLWNQQVPQHHPLNTGHLMEVCQCQ